jgi:hypothetical protein
MMVDGDVAPFDPSQCGKRLPKCKDLRLRLQVVLGTSPCK